jgi:site-specific recombinase XerD
MVNKMPVSTLAELTNISKSFISQVKSGKKAAPQRLLDAVKQYMVIKEPQHPDYIILFIQSREAKGCSKRTIEFYRDRLKQFGLAVDYLKATPIKIQRYLNNVKPNSNGLFTRHASYRAIRAFYGWLHIQYDFENPIKDIEAPITGRPILPALDESQVKTLIGNAESMRDKAIIALFVESGLRLSELTNIKKDDIDWQNRCIKVLGKGRKAALAPFGQLSETHLKQWLSEYQTNGNIWGLNAWGITSMLRRLGAKTGLTCNPHTFRRTFAVLLRKAGIDTMTIKELGRWESLEMVQRYTRSFSFQDSMKFYKSPLGK